MIVSESINLVLNKNADASFKLTTEAR
jgi:hypothetical protein